MKRHTFLALTLMGLFMGFGCSAQTDKGNLEQMIATYVKGGDANDSKLFAEFLDANFRVAFNNTKENKLSMLDKATYMSLIDGKKFGGDKRTVTVEALDVYGGTNATAKVKLVGEKATMYNYFSFAKVNGKWLLVQDFVYM